MSTAHDDDAPPASPIKNALARLNQERLDKHVRPEIQALVKRGKITLDEWMGMRANSWEFEHMYSALTDEALAHVVEHNLKNCFRRSVPSATYEDALSQHLAPLMLARWNAARAALDLATNELGALHASGVKAAEDAYARGRREAVEEAIKVLGEWTANRVVLDDFAGQLRDRLARGAQS